MHSHLCQSATAATSPWSAHHTHPSDLHACPGFSESLAGARAGRAGNLCRWTTGGQRGQQVVRVSDCGNTVIAPARTRLLTRARCCGKRVPPSAVQPAAMAKSTDRQGPFCCLLSNSLSSSTMKFSIDSEHAFPPSGICKACCLFWVWVWFGVILICVFRVSHSTLNLLLPSSNCVSGSSSKAVSYSKLLFF